MKALLPALVPWILALAITSLIVLVSSSFTGLQKIFFQSLMFGFGLSGSIAFLFSNNNAELKSFWIGFAALSQESRFCIAVIAIVATYFGGAMYVAAPDKSDRQDKVNPLATPASCDTNVGFDIPSNIPADDKVFFEQFLDKWVVKICFVLCLFLVFCWLGFVSKLFRICQRSTKCLMRLCSGSEEC